MNPTNRLKILAQSETERLDFLSRLALLLLIATPLRSYLDFMRQANYLINHDPEPEKERPQSLEERHRFDDTTECIQCGACTGSCPTYWADKNFISPAIIVQAHRFIRPMMHVALSYDHRIVDGRESPNGFLLVVLRFVIA